MPFVQKKNLCIKFIQLKSCILLTILCYNSVVSLVFMALKEIGYQYFLKDRSECVTTDSYFCSKKYLVHRRIIVFFLYLTNELENRNRVKLINKCVGKSTSARILFSVATLLSYSFLKNTRFLTISIKKES